MALHTLRGTMNLKTGQIKNTVDVTGQKEKTVEDIALEALGQLNINPEVINTIRDIHDRKENPDVPLDPPSREPFWNDPMSATIKMCREAKESLQDGDEARGDIHDGNWIDDTGSVTVDEFDPADYPPDAADLMESAVETFRQRGAVYGKSYLNQGHIMKGLFPKGVFCETVEDFQRMGILTIIISKLSRYCNNFATGHIDSIHDIGVYSFMLQEIDESLKTSE